MFDTENTITKYHVQFQITSYYANSDYNKSVVIDEIYAADSYDAVVNTISDDIENINFDVKSVINTETTEDPINIQVEYVQIVNEYGVLEYLEYN